MNSNIITSLMYDIITSPTCSAIVVILPFIGAYFLYNKTLINQAQVAIADIGKEIALIISNKISVSPLEGISYSYVDELLSHINIDNRHEALHSMMKDCLFDIHSRKKFPFLSEVQIAITIVAIITERYQQLKPYGVKLSGYGGFFSTYGEEIKTENTMFPFGTLMFDKWISDYKLIYQDLWMGTQVFNRRFFVKRYPDNNEFYNEEFINKWLDQIQEQIEKIHVQFRKLTSQIHIIESYKYNAEFSRKYYESLLVLFLTFICGYITPRILHDLELLDVQTMFLLSFTTISSLLLSIWLFLKEVKNNETAMLRQIEFEKINHVLKELQKDNLRYKFVDLRNFKSLRNNLRMPKSVIRLLDETILEIKKYNKLVESLTASTDDFFYRLFAKYECENELKSKSNISIEISDLIDQSFDIAPIFNKLRNENGIFRVSCNRHHSSNELITINFTDLTKSEREDLVKSLEELRRNNQFKYILSQIKCSREKIKKCSSKLNIITSNYIR